MALSALNTYANTLQNLSASNLLNTSSAGAREALTSQIGESMQSNPVDSYNAQATEAPTAGQQGAVAVNEGLYSPDTGTETLAARENTMVNTAVQENQAQPDYLTDFEYAQEPGDISAFDPEADLNVVAAPAANTAIEPAITDPMDSPVEPAIQPAIQEPMAAQAGMTTADVNNALEAYGAMNGQTEQSALAV